MARTPTAKIYSKLATGLAGLIFLAGCSSSKPAEVPIATGAASVLHPAAESAPISDYVAVVRDGTITGYPSATIGKAFEAAFHDFQWRSTQAADGVRVVNFTGRLPANMRPECPAAKKGAPARPCTEDAKVTFEWTFPSGSRSFHLSYADPEPWPAGFQSTREMLMFIFG